MKRKIFEISFDDEGGRYVVEAPCDSPEIIRNNREYFGGLLMTIGEQVLAGRWPEEATDFSKYGHVVPHKDVIDHCLSGPNCQCRPRVDPVNKVIVHCALDGRPDYFNGIDGDQHLWEVIDAKK